MRWLAAPWHLGSSGWMTWILEINEDSEGTYSFQLEIGHKAWILNPVRQRLSSTLTALTHETLGSMLIRPMLGRPMLARPMLARPMLARLAPLAQLTSASASRSNT